MMMGLVVLAQVCPWMEGWRGGMEAAKGGHTAGRKSKERAGSDEGRHARGPDLGELLPSGPRGCFWASQLRAASEVSFFPQEMLQ